MSHNDNDTQCNSDSNKCNLVPIKDSEGCEWRYKLLSFLFNGNSSQFFCFICSAQFSDGYFWTFLWWFYWLLFYFEFYVTVPNMINECGWMWKRLFARHQQCSVRNGGEFLPPTAQKFGYWSFWNWNLRNASRGIPHVPTMVSTGLRAWAGRVGYPCSF